MLIHSLGWFLTMCGLMWSVWGMAHALGGILTGIEGVGTHGLMAFAPMIGALFVTALATVVSWAGLRLRTGHTRADLGRRCSHLSS